MKPIRAFTLIELLVVIVIIAVLTALSVPLIGSINLVRDQSAALKNFRDLASGLSTYAINNNGELPAEGEDQPSWESAGDPEYKDAWYNAIPRMLGQLGVGDYPGSKQPFYRKSNVLNIPAAKYPRDKENRPYFAVSINSKLRSKGQEDAIVRTTNIENPSRTVTFQESGLPGEKPFLLSQQGKYDGQAKSYATRTVARYAGKTIVAFADTHVEVLDARYLVNTQGSAYFPQVGPEAGNVYWTIDPEENPND